MKWERARLMKAVLDAGFRQMRVSESEYSQVLQGWGYTAREVRAEVEAQHAMVAGGPYGLGVGGGAGDVPLSERFVDGRCNGCGVPKQARW